MIRHIENSNDFVGSRTHHFPPCSIVVWREPENDENMRTECASEDITTYEYAKVEEGYENNNWI
jgi:hypothetical protein